MAKQQFQAESKRLLDMMINSIYTHREIFLRELISNASDAIDKRHFKSLTDASLVPEEGFEIHLAADEDARTLTISDNGIGMTKEELEHNLGTIAQSGSLAFKQENQTDDTDIIGQFGVGFYASFMVASHVKVVSKACGSEQAYVWESDGADGYTIEPGEKDSYGTDIILTIKPDPEGEDEDTYSEFLQTYRLAGLVRKYSDYIRYPIKMQMPHSQEKPKPEDAPEDYKPEYETVYTEDTLNSMIPLWKKAKKDITQDEYDEFYRSKFMDYMKPLRTIHFHNEGLTASYDALLYIPSQPPFDYYSKDFSKGLSLYTSGVMIMEKCADLLPDYFGFVRGLVDSSDLSLNISREMQQHDRQLKAIAISLEKKIRSELLKMQKDEREEYIKFWNAFGYSIKAGAYANYGADKEKLRDLMMFYSAKNEKLITLKEYREAMPEDQEEIYYAAGSSTDALSKLPQAEMVRKHDYDILYLTADIDEFIISQLESQDNKKFRSITAGDLNLSSEEEKKEAEEKSTANRAMFDAMKEALDGKVKDVRVSSRLVSDPVCLTSEGNLSIEMERVLNNVPNNGNHFSAEKILEINASHPIFEKLIRLYTSDPDKLKTYAKLLYDQAMLIAGMPVEDPAAFTQAMCDLMAE